MRPVRFLGDSLKFLRDFPQSARHDAGYQLDKVQRGDQPDDFKPMPVIGNGVDEIRVSSSSGAYRVIYLARQPEAVYVLHAFHKKTQATPKKDLKIAKIRFGDHWEAGYEQTRELSECLGCDLRYAPSRLPICEHGLS